MFTHLIEMRRPFTILLLCYALTFPSLGRGAALPSLTARQQLEQALTLGSSALAEGNNTKAEAAFRRALELNPQSVMILNNLAISLARQHKEEEAITFYKWALKLAPGDSVTQRNLGVAFFRAGRYSLALPLLQSFAKATPTFQALDLTGLDLFALDRYEEAGDFLGRASALEPADLPTLNMLGKAYLRTKNYTGVSDVFARIMTLNPDSPDAHYMLGMADDKLFREEEAIRQLKQVLAVDPHYPGANTALGVIYWRTDNLDAAEAAFREELNRYPKDPIANCTLGRILQRRSRLEEALHYLEGALAVNPSYKEALLSLGEVNVSRNQPAQALTPLRRAVALDADDAEAHYLLGSALIKLGRAKEGIQERQICGRIRAVQRARNSQSTNEAR